ncbi:hypothetical protein CesoFtcFv8_013461 [Champsocephalus esox]|uniref:Arf-GAP with coiled-coil, ANK repeat and PH domain-containing protein n=1 Tax=Champsocephalus esox TaxID=159716 RepID=A0AAN8GVW0_9TELE|nr:hypothetical protein CesoFtcFv8_013461 [Champsocephalus esox]
MSTITPAALRGRNCGRAEAGAKQQGLCSVSVEPIPTVPCYNIPYPSPHTLHNTLFQGAMTARKDASSLQPFRLLERKGAADRAKANPDWCSLSPQQEPEKGPVSAAGIHAHVVGVVAGSGAAEESSDSDAEQEGPQKLIRKVSTSGQIRSKTSIKEGLLLKQTSSFQRWKKRYFKLRGRTLYYAKDAKSLIFDEVDLSDASVAESSTKNVNNSFTVITPFRRLILCAENRKEMEDWISSLKSVQSENITRRHSLMWNISQGCTTGTPAPTHGPPSATCAKTACRGSRPTASPAKVRPLRVYVSH